MDSVLNECAQLRTQQNAASHARDDIMSRMELVKDQMAGLEVRLGLPYANDSSTTGLDQYGGRRAGTSGAMSSPSKRGSALNPSIPTGSVLDRINRLERRADALAEGNAKAEDEVVALLGKMRELEPRLEALALAAASTRLEADAESTSRVKEAEKRLLSRIQSVESNLESKLSAVSAQTGVTVSSELDKRVNALYDHVDVQVQQLCGDLDRLSREKVDLGALEHYSQRISSLFEGVAQGLADEVSTLVGQLRSEVAAVARSVDEAHMANQVLHDNVKGEMEAMRQLSVQVKEAVSTAQDSLSSTPRVVEEMRGTVHQLVVDAEHLQKAVTGLNSAMASTSSALEMQSHKMGQLAHKLNGLSADVGGVKDMVYGAPASAPSASMGGSGSTSSPGSVSLLSKLAYLDRAMTELTASLGSKADDALLRELERRIANLARQTDVTGEGLRSLSASAFKRADEHASAIQRLTLAVTGNLEERPTTTAVKHLIETAALELRERCDNALAPLWDAVRILQSGLRDAAGELKAVSANVGGLQQTQTDSRSKGVSDRSSIMAALRKALDEEVGSLRSELEERLEKLDAGVSHSAEQLEVHTQVQDRLVRLNTAVEEQLATQVAAWRAGNQQLRGELNSRVEAVTNRVDAVATGLATRVEAVEIVCKKHAEDIQARVSSAALSESTVREIAGSLARNAAKQEVARYSEKEDMKWQVWLEEHGRRQEHLASHGDVIEALEKASRQIKQDLETATTTRVDEDLEAVTQAYATKKEVEELATASMIQRADRAAIEAQVRHLAEEVEVQASSLSVLRAEAVTRSELTAELARKVDLATYLAQGSARAAAASAAAYASRAPLIVRCSGNGSSGSFQEGQRVKVSAPLKVYHVQKHQSGLDLQGMEGVVVADVTQYEGKVLSANFPIYVEFVIPAEPKPIKFKAHLAAEELEAL
ncbi:hypothetical protein GPECTOR_80g172 [Gonium pectorale]|uniref:Ferredoxin thioredoxin reductase alpha chain domain-containing protein n=1 Tax=Gonium pectorale TaxID=33097 RepID=A0A150G1R5_GONPE|nr:hypothetical protein GPECTOR_80g172 [Gonium pectorale]|eukprot:KXZ43812.1 hypothetical protein GPECTOR_80g172 [Gonium pectorale]